MSKMSKAIVALGVVAGLGVAAMPLSSYATTTTGKVQVNVDGAISVAIVEPTNSDADTEGVSLTGNTLDLQTVMIGAAPTIGTMGVQVKTKRNQWI